MLFCLLLAAALAWFILMTWLSHQDGDHTRRTSMFWAQIFSAKGEDEQTLQRRNAALRRLAHPGLFAVWAVLVAATCRVGGLAPVWLALPLVWAWGDEATKPLVPGRHFAWPDVGLNLAGCLLGFAAYAVIAGFLL